MVRVDEALRGRVARLRGLPGLRGVAAAVALAAVVTAVGTAAVSGQGAGETSLISSVTTTPPDAAAAAVLAAARTHLGQKYVFGGSGPTSWDCSGFTQALWTGAGGVATIPRTARLQQLWATPVPAAQVLPGDLYFLGTPATHVGIVVGAGMVLDASSSQGHVVLRALWTATDITFGRVPRPGAVPVSAPAGSTAATPPAPAPTAAPATVAPPPATPTATAPPATTPPPAAAAPPAPGFVAPATTGSTSFVAAAEHLVGAAYQTGGIGPSYDDGAVVAVAWHKAQGGVLPLDRNALAARSTPVRAQNLLPGDLVIYGTSVVWHVGVYVGKGMMVDSSRINGRVVLRKIFTSPDRHFGRLH